MAGSFRGRVGRRATDKRPSRVFLTRAGLHAQTLHERMFRILWLPHFQLDELRTRLRSANQILWLWLAIDPRTKILPVLYLTSPNTTHGTSGVVACVLSRMSRPHESLRVRLVQPRERGGRRLAQRYRTVPQPWQLAEPADDGRRARCSPTPYQRFPLEEDRSQRWVQCLVVE